MATRRARIKAVASIPIRKKQPSKDVKKDDATILNTANVNNETGKQCENPRDEIFLSPANVNKASSLLKSPFQKAIFENQNMLKSPHPHKSPLSKSIKETFTATKLPSPFSKTQSVNLSPIKSPKLTNVKSTTENSNSSLKNEKNMGPISRRRITKPVINVPSKKSRLVESVDISHAFSSDNISNEIRLNIANSNSNDIENLEILNHNINVALTTDQNNKIISGIVPLSSLSDNEAITNVNGEPTLSTEYSFDPIIPLPYPPKNRPKLKPTPHIAIRRNSIQGSASESEDDSKKNKKEDVNEVVVLCPIPSQQITTTGQFRHRNDSVCSVSEEIYTQPNIAATPRHKNKCRSGECSRRAIAKRRALQRAPQNPLTMSDLIYYNPPNNSSKLLANRRDEIKAAAKELEVKKDVIEENAEPKNDNHVAPVPQVKLGPNGEIIIDEQSLVIETTDAVKSRSELSKLSVVYESGLNSGSGGMYRRALRSRDWSSKETLRFYKALNTIGTDFALMLPLFPGRTRKDLKVKFKREEKHNLKLVDKALLNPLNFDITELEEQLTKDQKVDEPPKEKPVPKQPKPPKKIKYSGTSLASRSLGIECNTSASDRERKQKDISITQENQINSDEVCANKNNTSSTPSCNTNNEPQSKTPNTSVTAACSMEPGTMFISVDDIPGKAGHNTLQAFVTQLINGKAEMFPVQLEFNLLMSIAKEMNILKPDEHYEAVTYATT